jgi:hypothetical protein
MSKQQIEVTSTSEVVAVESSGYQLLIAGSRNFSNFGQMDRVLRNITANRKPSRVIEGGAAGGDSLGGAWARWQGLDVTTVKADWARFGRRAGYVRNAAMVALLQPGDLVVAFYGPDGATKGTANTVKLALQRGIAVRIFNQEDPTPADVDLWNESVVEGRSMSDAAVNDAERSVTA